MRFTGGGMGNGCWIVAILGASELTYVEARESQKEADWIRANENSLPTRALAMCP